MLKEFGFNPGRFFLDACAVWLLAAAFAALTYYSLATAGLGSHSGLMLWWRQWLGQVHDDGLSGRPSTKLLPQHCGVARTFARTVPLRCLSNLFSKWLGQIGCGGPASRALDQSCRYCCCVCECSHTGPAMS